MNRSEKVRSTSQVSIDRIFKPFPQVYIPIFSEFTPTETLKMMQGFKGKGTLLGLISLPAEEPLSSASGSVRDLRRMVRMVSDTYGLTGNHRVRVSYDPWLDLQDAIQAYPNALLVLEWPDSFTFLGIRSLQEVLKLPCNVAILKGDWIKDNPCTLVPIRGGPNSELALRFGLALPSSNLSVLHIPQSDVKKGEVDAAFRGLARILPSLPEIHYEYQQVEDPLSLIVERLHTCDLVIAGMRASGETDSLSFGPTLDLMFTKPVSIIAVKSARTEPATYTSPENLISGSKAISILVDKWFAENTYHAAEFDDLERLAAIKKQQKMTISLALPALNEEKTIGNVIQQTLEMLVHRYPVLDEIVVLDSNSTDNTRQIAENAGLSVYVHQEILPGYGKREGKGDALWKSLFVTRGDILVWCDTDILNFHPRFIYGVIGPMLTNPSLQFVKGFYQRPLATGEGLQSTGGGRVTELTARPLINLFYPELSGVIQPLSGEYGGRRASLEQLRFFSGYGVETGLLIDIFERFGLSSIAQVDLLERIHHNQPLEALSIMSFRIIQAVLRKLEDRVSQPLLEDINKSMKMIRYKAGNYYLEVQEVAEQDRPPMLEIPEYRQLWEKR